MTKSFTLAHLSDLHLGPLPGLPLSQTNLKRCLGTLNWHKNRKHVHRPETVLALLADLRTQHADHVAVTGDLINIGLPAEYEAAAAFLPAFGPPSRVTVVPGNHDIYSTLRGHGGIELWREYMQGEASESRPDPTEIDRPAGFPFVRQFGGVALIGLNSSVPTRPFYAGGRLGRAQLDRLAQVLERLGKAGLCRVVLIHHPPLPGQASPAKALEDAAALVEVLSTQGCELILHGHNHRFSMAELKRESRVIPVVGVPSASVTVAHKDEMLARYHLLRIEAAGAQTRVELVARGIRRAGGAVVELEREWLHRA